ncbi:hypothetical protein ACIBBE_46970 [Streptomyces sp. NPDC051644]|uniref:hypothetical protein n=1 Tax=Streptomyces sp. NPDC051644 TaxID=3365666 RepID=UPI0037A773DF
MPIADAQVLDLSEISDLDQTRVVESLEWDGVTYELRDHVNDWIVVTWSKTPTATAHPLMTEGGLALHLAVAEVILGEAKTRVRWNEHNQAGVAASSDGARWATTWIQAGRPHYSEHDDWDAAHLALADRLDEMSEGPVYAGSNIEDEIARAYLHRAAADIRSAVAVAKLGAVMRDAQPFLQKERQVTAIANHLGVERKFLYRVFAGEEWRRR